MADSCKDGDRPRLRSLEGSHGVSRSVNDHSGTAFL